MFRNVESINKKAAPKGGPDTSLSFWLGLFRSATLIAGLRYARAGSIGRSNFQTVVRRDRQVTPVEAHRAAH